MVLSSSSITAITAITIDNSNSDYWINRKIIVKILMLSNTDKSIKL